MTPLQTLELKLLEKLPSLSLRPSLERAAEAGELLLQAKELVPHGEFLPWVRRVGLSRSTAGEFMAVARHLRDPDARNYRRSGNLMGVREFLDHFRVAKQKERQRERQETREALARERGHLPDRISLVHADCRSFPFPSDIDVIFTDPPWADLDSYRTLAGIAAAKLRVGGLLLAIVGTAHLPDVLDVFRAAGLTYVWTLVFAYTQSNQNKASGAFRGTHRPVVVVSRGEWGGLSGATVKDFVAVAAEPKPHQAWEQPESVSRHYLGALCPPGGLVADPFAGSGTTAVSCHALGLRFVGTEIDVENYRVARGRIAKLTAGD